MQTMNQTRATKIKVAYGLDTRLWRYHRSANNVSMQPTYTGLCAYVCESFGFSDATRFRLSLLSKDISIPISSAADFEAAFVSAQTENQKSLKLYIEAASPVVSSSPSTSVMESVSLPSTSPIESSIGDYSDVKSSDTESENGAKHHAIPDRAALESFFSDATVMDEMSDVLAVVLKALQESNCEMSLMDTLHAVVLSSPERCKHVTAHQVWPYVLHVVLPARVPSLEAFVVPMLSSGRVDIDQMKPWITSMVHMLGRRAKKSLGAGINERKHSGFANLCGAGGWKRGRAHRGHHHGHHHGRHHVHHAQRFWGSVDPQSHQQEGNDVQHCDTQAQEFKYTQDLADIMNMGFTDTERIKHLLNMNQGNKQAVVEALVNSWD